MTDTPPKIVVVGDPVLATPAREVTEFDAELAKLVDDLFASLAVAEGVGLAAPQIGVGLQVFVWDCPDERGGADRSRGHVVNPTIEVGSDKQDGDEGCLSVPGPFHELERAQQATVRGVDKDGKPVEATGTGFLARCFQHETDHLRGVLYIDHLPRNRRRRVLREMEPFEWNAPSS